MLRGTVLAVGAALASAGLAGCASVGPRGEATPAAVAAGTPLRYVALGDSYTIGTSVAAPDRFPDQLVAALSAPPALELVANLGVNGYTSGDLIAEELPALEALEPGFATVLIGVNDVVQDVPADRYEANAVTILDALLAVLPPERIVVVTIPDYTVTPAGADYGDPDRKRAGIEANNAAMARLATVRGIAVVDIFDLSSEAVADPTLVADDGLHPSGAQYARWVDRIAPVVERLLGR